MLYKIDKCFSGIVEALPDLADDEKRAVVQKCYNIIERLQGTYGPSKQKSVNKKAATKKVAKKVVKKKEAKKKKR